MNSLIGSISMLAIVIMGLAVMVGKVELGQAVTRIGSFLLLLVLMPCIVGVFVTALSGAMKPLLLIAGLALVAMVLVRLLIRM